MAATTFIYALKDPRTDKIRYVGKSDHPTKRLSAHRYRGKQPTHKSCWIRGLAMEGLKPNLEVLDEVPKTQWELWEREYIRLFRALGFKLVNLSDGGGGPINVVPSEESCRKISEALKRAYAEGRHPRVWAGKKLGDEHRAKVSRTLVHGWFKGKKHTDAYKANMARVKKGQIPYEMTEATRIKMSAASRGRVWTPEQRRKIIKARSVKDTPEQRARRFAARSRIGKSNKERWANPEYRAKMMLAIRAAKQPSPTTMKG